MADRFENYVDTPTAPARRTWLVVPDDTVPLDPLPKGLRVNVAGTLVYKAVDSSVAVTMTVYAGERLDVRALLITTGTTASVHAFA